MIEADTPGRSFIGENLREKNACRHLFGRRRMIFGRTATRDDSSWAETKRMAGSFSLKAGSGHMTELIQVPEQCLLEALALS